MEEEKELGGGFHPGENAPRKMSALLEYETSNCLCLCRLREYPAQVVRSLPAMR